MKRKILSKLKSNKGVKLYKTAKKLIPGGTQLLSKRPEMFAPDLWPSYYSKAKGCKIWDLNNTKYTDMSFMSVGACVLGYADRDVDMEVIKKIKLGVNSSLNCIEEVELAKELIDLHPWFDMARFSRSGGEAMSIAVRIARAHTKKDIIIFSGYHGWNDWYIAANLKNKSNLNNQLIPGIEANGVPKSLYKTAITFEANNFNSLIKKIKGIENKIAAIVIEPARGVEPDVEYLKKLKGLSREIKSVLIFDEITSGFRMCAGGIHRSYKIYPDIAVFAKSIANGYAMSAVLGTEKVMNAAQKTFISSTNWTERVGPAAALATIKKFKQTNAEKYLIEIGNKVKKIWHDVSKKNNLEINITGLPSLPMFSFKSKKSIQLETLFTTEMLSHGFLGFKQFRPSLAHKQNDLNNYANACEKVFKLISEDKNLKNLKSPIHQTGFKRLTKN